MLADLDREHLPNHHATHLLPTFQQSFMHLLPTSLQNITHPAPDVQPSHGTQLSPQTHGAESASLGTDNEQHHAVQSHHEAQLDRGTHVAEPASLFSSRAQHPDSGNPQEHRALLGCSPQKEEHPRVRYSAVEVAVADEEHAFTAATGCDASSREDSASRQGQAAVVGQSQSQPDQATFSDSAYAPFKAHARECSEQQLHLQQQQLQQRQQQQHQQQQQLQQQQSVMSGGGTAMLRNMSANRPGSLSHRFARSNLSSIEEGTGSGIGIGNHGAGATGVAFHPGLLRQTWKMWP